VELEKRRPGASALLAQLRGELRRQRFTANAIADRLGVAEPTIRRWLRGQGLTLERLDQLCALAGIDIRDLVAAAPDSGAARFTLAQERVLAADRGLAFLFFSILNGWQPDDFEQEFGLPPARVDAYLVRLTRLGLIDIGIHGRVRPLTARAVAWRRGGPLAVAFDRTVKHLFLTMNFGAGDAHYVADMVKLSPAGRARVHALFEALRLDIHLLAEQDRAAKLDRYDWSALFMLVRPLDMAEVGRGIV
jgi:transcriptional regulator with XRE-family HTH domain